MEFSLITQVMEVLRLVILSISLIIAVLATRSLVQSESNDFFHQIKRKVFVWLMWGIFFLVIGSIGKYITDLQGKTVWIWEVFFLLYYLFFLISFIYFWKISGKVHQMNAKEKVLFLGVICLVVVILGWFFTTLILPANFKQSNLIQIAPAAYPLIISLLFLSTYVVHSRVRVKIIDRSLGYIASGIFVYFVGYLIYTYNYFSQSQWEFFPLIYVSLFLISSFYYLLGFLVAKNKAKK
jgi:hypothetical protein